MASYANVGSMPGYGTSMPGIGDFGSYYLNMVPQAGFWSYLMGQNLGGNDPRSQYAQQQYNRAYGQYSANSAKEPGLGFYDYLMRGDMGNFGSEYENRSPQQRFDFTSRTLTPRARFVPYSG